MKLLIEWVGTVKMLHTHIWKVLSLNLCHYKIYLDSAFLGFLSSSWQMTGGYLELAKTASLQTFFSTTIQHLTVPQNNTPTKIAVHTS